MSKIKSTLLLILPTIIFLSINNMTYFAQAESQFDTNENGVNEIVWSLNDIMFYQDCPVDDGSSNDVSVCNANLPEETIKKLESLKIKEKAEENMERYEYAASKTGLIWQIVAALHYREGGMDSGKSILNGEKLYDHINSDGKKVVSDPNEDAKNAAEHLISMGKSIYGVDITTDQSVEALGKAFLAYNRGNMYTDKCGNGNISYTNSPYVMNYYDDDHMEMTWNHADSYCNGTKLNDVEGSKNQQLGALVVVAYLCGDGNNSNDGPDDSAGAVVEESDDSSATGGASSTSTTSGYAKKIAEQAYKLAYPHSADNKVDRGKDNYNAYSGFVEATKELGTWEENKDHGPDCGYFVKAVISSVDTSLVKKPKKASISSSTFVDGKWETFDYSGKKIPVSELQSGDIIWYENPGLHWFIVAESPEDHKLRVIEASYCHEGHWSCGEWGHVGRELKKTDKLSSHEHQIVYRAKGGGPACNSCDQGSLNINGTAVCLAWPLGTEDEAKYPGGSATDAFTKAQAKVAPIHNTGDKAAETGASCDVFVATTVRWSGYDKDYPVYLNGTGQQLEYVQNHPNLWDFKQLEGKGKDELQAGDIVMENCSGTATCGHTYIIVEDEGGKLYIAAGSHADHYGAIQDFYTPKGTAYRIRPTGKVNNSSKGVSVTDGVKSSSITGTLTGSISQNNHNIGATARYFAYPEKSNDQDIKSHAYRAEEWEKFRESVGKYKININGSLSSKEHIAMGRSCVLFVWGVLKYAGLTEEFGNNEHLDKTLDKEADWEYLGTDLPVSELKDGDVWAWTKLNSNGNPGHYGIFVRDADGTPRTIEASLSIPAYGRVMKKISNSSIFRGKKVWRNKNNQTGSLDDNCDICTGSNDSNGGGALKEGGYDSVEEAKKAIIAQYMKYNGNPGTDFHTSKCKNSRDNCSTFSLWFVREYLGWDTAKTNMGGDGLSIAKNVYNAYHDKYPKMTKSSTPTVYSIASWDSPVGKIRSNNHTGVIVGIDKSKDQILIAHAAWCAWEGEVWEDKLSKYIGHGTYVDVSAYVKGLEK